MATNILISEGTDIVLADTTDYAGDLGTRTDQIDLTSLATVSARQSDKIDFGDPRAAVWACFAAIEFDVAPVSGAIVSFHLAPSPSVTAGTANPGGVVGADGAYTGTTGDSLADSIKQLMLIGNMIATSDVATVVEFQFIGFFSPPERYGTIVVYNQTLQSFEGDAIEMGIRLVPLIDQVQ